MSLVLCRQGGKFEFQYASCRCPQLEPYTEVPSFLPKACTGCRVGVMEGDSEVHSDTALLHLLCLLRQLEAAQEVVAALRAVGGGAVSEATQRLLLRRGIASPLATALPCGADYQR